MNYKTVREGVSDERKSAGHHILPRRPRRRRMVLQTALGLAGLVLGLVGGFVGCGKSHSGVVSSNEYSYAAETPEKLAGARARFESVVKCFESAGLRATSLEQTPMLSQAVLEAKDTEARLTFLVPDTGFATITLAYKCETQDPQTKAAAERLLAQAQALLAPAQPPADAK